MPRLPAVSSLPPTSAGLLVPRKRNLLATAWMREKLAAVPEPYYLETPIPDRKGGSGTSSPVSHK